MCIMLGAQFVLVMLSSLNLEPFITESHREVTKPSTGLRPCSKLTHLMLIGNEFYTNACLVPHSPSLYISQHHKSKSSHNAFHFNRRFNYKNFLPGTWEVPFQEKWDAKLLCQKSSNIVSVVQILKVLGLISSPSVKKKKEFIYMTKSNLLFSLGNYI